MSDSLYLNLGEIMITTSPANQIRQWMGRRAVLFDIHQHAVTAFDKAEFDTENENVIHELEKEINEIDAQIVTIVRNNIPKSIIIQRLIEKGVV